MQSYRMRLLFKEVKLPTKNEVRSLRRHLLFRSDGWMSEEDLDRVDENGEGQHAEEVDG